MSNWLTVEQIKEQYSHVYFDDVESVKIGTGAVIELGVLIGKRAQIHPDAWIGKAAEIGENAVIGKRVVIGAYAEICANEVISQPTDIKEKHELLNALIYQCGCALADYVDACDAPDLRLVRSEFERLILKETMRLTKNNLSAASRMLGMNRITIRKKLKHHGLYVQPDR